MGLTFESPAKNLAFIRLLFTLEAQIESKYFGQDGMFCHINLTAFCIVSVG